MVELVLSSLSLQYHHLVIKVENFVILALALGSCNYWSMPFVYFLIYIYWKRIFGFKYTTTKINGIKFLSFYLMIYLQSHSFIITPTTINKTHGSLEFCHGEKKRKMKRNWLHKTHNHKK